MCSLRMIQKVEKNDCLYFFRVNFTFGKDGDGLTVKGIKVFSLGAFMRHIFLMLGKTTLFTHTSGLILSE